MKKAYKYKNIIAAFLLALYAFVVTPVEWWHHHDNQRKQSCVSRVTNNENSLKGVTISSESDCKICSYKYPAHNDEIFLPADSTASINADKNGHYILSFISIPFLSISNKGPPFVS